MADKLDPFDIEALESAVNDSATRVSTIWISFLIFSLYMLVAAGTVTQRQLFLDEPTKLPILNIDLPLWWFFLLAPILFVILHVYVLLQVLLLGRTAAAYNAAIARSSISLDESSSLRQRLANTLFAQIFAGSPRERDGFVGVLLRGVAWITLAITPILIVLAFQVRFLPYHSHLVIWTHRLLIVIELLAFFMIWPLALDAQRDFQWPKVGTTLKRLSVLPLQLIMPKGSRREVRLWLWQQAPPVTAVLLFVVVALSIVTFPGEPHVNLFKLKPPLSVQCDGWLDQKIANIYYGYDRIDMRDVEAVDAGKLAEIEKRTSGRDLLPSHGERTLHLLGRDLNCSDLASVDLRRVDLNKARLNGAYLGSAILDGATLLYAQLQGADLRNAQLKGADFGGALLQGANFSGAQLQGADLGIAQLQGANLESAQLQGAHLSGADFQGANLSRAQFQGSNLVAAEFQGADFSSADLEGTNFYLANLEGADFSNAKLDHSILASVWIWHANSIDCSAARVTVHFASSSFKNDTQSMIDAFIDRSVAEIPNGDPFREKAMERMHKGLDIQGRNSNAAVIAKVWDDCEASKTKVSQRQFYEELASMLRNRVCNAPKNRAIFAAGLISNWTLEYFDNPAFDVAMWPVFSARLARGLLSEDGMNCTATQELNEATKTELKAMIASASDATSSSTLGQSEPATSHLPLALDAGDPSLKSPLRSPAVPTK